MFDRFQNTLQSVFYSFHDTYRNIGGRITAENLKDQILKLLRIWENWSLYPQAFITELHYAFLKGNNSDNTKVTAHSNTRDTSNTETDSKHTHHDDEDKPAPQLKKDELLPPKRTPTQTTTTSIPTSTSSTSSESTPTSATSTAAATTLTPTATSTSTSAEEGTTASTYTAAVEDEELEDVDGTALTEEDILELQNLPPNLLQTVHSIQSLLIKV